MISGNYLIDITNHIFYFKNEHLIAFDYELLDMNTLNFTVNKKVTKKFSKIK
jgi:hypothetical protein